MAFWNACTFCPVRHWWWLRWFPGWRRRIQEVNARTLCQRCWPFYQQLEAKQGGHE